MKMSSYPETTKHVKKESNHIKSQHTQQREKLKTQEQQIIKQFYRGYNMSIKECLITIIKEQAILRGTYRTSRSKKYSYTVIKIQNSLGPTAYYAQVNEILLS